MPEWTNGSGLGGKKLIMSKFLSSENPDGLVPAKVRILLPAFKNKALLLFLISLLHLPQILYP